MKHSLYGLAVGTALTLALAAVSAARDDKKDKDKGEDADVVAARKEVLGVYDLVKAGKADKDVAAKAVAIQKKGVDLNYMMAVYKIKEKGGLGYGGDKPDPKSGIEAKIIALQRTERGPSATVLKKEKDDLIKLAQLNVAMAEIAKPHFPGPKGGKNKKDWDKWLDDQKKAAKDLMAAVNKGDSKAVATAAKNLLATCTECHETYRN
jgi:hypothetical protein